MFSCLTHVNSSVIRELDIVLGDVGEVHDLLLGHPHPHPQPHLPLLVLAVVARDVHDIAALLPGAGGLLQALPHQRAVAYRGADAGSQVRRHAAAGDTMK